MSVAASPASPASEIGFNRDTLWIALITFVLTVVAGVVASLLSLPELLVKSFAGAGALIPPVIGYVTWRRKRGKKADLAALGQGRIERPRLLVVIIVGVALVAVETIVGGVIGLIIDIGAAYMGGTQLQVIGAVSEVSLFITLPVFLVLAYLILARASHYLGSAPFRWLALAVGVYLVFRLIVTLSFLAFSIYGQFFELWPTVIAIFIITGLLVLVAFVADRVQRRRHAEFVVSRFFHKLPPADQEAVRAMISEVVEAPARPAVAE